MYEKESKCLEGQECGLQESIQDNVYNLWNYFVKILVPRDPESLELPPRSGTSLHLFIKEQGKHHLSHLPETAGPCVERLKHPLNIFLFPELKTVNIKGADGSQHLAGVWADGLEAACTLSLPRLCDFGSVGLSLRVVMISVVRCLTAEAQSNSIETWTEDFLL